MTCTILLIKILQILLYRAIQYKVTFFGSNLNKFKKI
jgi:hypothetical protein